MNQQPQLIAGGTLAPMTFAKVSTAADDTCLQAGANDVIIGITQVGTDNPPGLTGATSNAATVGESIQLYGLGDICSLTAGSGGWTAGDRLKSDASGNGVTIATSGVSQNCGAVALETVAAGGIGRVQIQILSVLVSGASGSITATDITGTDSSLDIVGQTPTASAAGGSVNITGAIGGATSGTGGAATMTGGAGTAGNSAGGVATVTGGAGQGTAAGGIASMVGGASGAGATGNGAVSKIVGGAALSTNGSGGAAQVTGGVATGTGTGGAVTIASGASAGASGTAGSVTMDCGSKASGTAGTIAIGDANAAATYLNRGPLAALQVGLTLTALGTVQSSTPTSAQLLGGFLTQTSVTGAGTVTLPTGTALSAACARTPVVGDSFQCVFANLGGGQTLTVTGQTGTTVISGAAVATAKTAVLTFINTGSNAWSIAVAGG